MEVNNIQSEFLSEVKEHEAILFKIIGLYADTNEDREDLRQEILFQAFKSFPNFKRASRFSTWFYKVALNTALSFIKKNNMSKEKILARDNEMIVRDENAELLYHIIKSLNEVDRMIMTLHLDGYKNKEIAEITGMVPTSLNVKIHRIKSVVIQKFKQIHND